MIDADIKSNETKRLEALRSYQILDSLPEEAFDNLTKLASEIANVPIAMINLIDENRQWTKSMVGIPEKLREAPRKETVCQYTIKEPGVTEIQNLDQDFRTSNLPSVNQEGGLRYYFGIPLVTKNKYAIGTLCVLDYEEKELSETQIDQLKIVANEVMTHLELHKQNRELQKLNEYKVQLMKMLSHDMRSPLNGIIGLSSMLREQMEDEQSKHIEIIDIIEQSSTQLNQMIDEVMNYTIIESEGLTLSPGKVNLQEIIDNILQLYRPAARIKSIDLEFYAEGLEEPVWLDGDKFEQVIGNLLSNAIKYTKSGGRVKLLLLRKNNTLDLKVIDSGIGMSNEESRNLLQNKNRFKVSKGTSGEKSSGIGFSIIKHIIVLFDGYIEIESKEGEGTTVHVEIPVVTAG
ncbi:GAF domain-containing sensor histidine kinase [Rhodohalobacter sp. 8-1]|uniref:GAF domain-containing sensor histidine kinase n=1 Tax=Rhodohalobacter sp. 8-1 TaxID=3131972 RepID=UPI0030EF1384